MTVSKDLFLSILAMDAYNRGYNSGIGSGADGLGSAIAINLATPHISSKSEKSIRLR